MWHRIIRTVENETEIYETIKRRKGLLNICCLKLKNCSLKIYEIISHDNPLKFCHVTKLTLTTIATILKKTATLSYNAKRISYVPINIS